MLKALKSFFYPAVLAGLGLVALGSGQARAGFTVALDPGQPTTVSPGVFQYNYTATTATDDQINPGDFFRIYDFFGYNGTSGGPAGWTVASSNSNPTPPPNVLLSHGDDPAIPNLTFTYNGATPIAGPSTIPGFFAQSTFGSAITTKDFVGRLTKTSTGTKVDSVGDVRVPGVPEPASMISAGIGAVLLGLGYARSRRKLAV